MDTTGESGAQWRLDASKTVVIGGAGPYGLTAALALTEKLGATAPRITLVEPSDLESFERWEPCKGCAGGVLRGTIEHIAATYDHRHLVEFESDGITIRLPDGKRYLSRTRIDEMAFHLPHELRIPPPIVRFSGMDVVTPVFRVEGPRHLHDDWLTYHHIGLSPFLYRILKANNPQVEWVQGRLRLIDIDGARPAAELHWHDQTTRLEADYLLVTTGISKSRPPLLKEGGVVRELPHVAVLKTLMLATELPINAHTERIFNIRRGPVTTCRAHLFMTQGPAHYILTMPKTVGTHIALGVAAFGQEGREDITPEVVNEQLSGHPLLKGAGIRFDMEESFCHCGAFIPSSTLPAHDQYGRGYSLGGDLAGGLRLWKNGIGTAINEAESFVDYLVAQGYAPDSLERYFETTQQRVVADNEVGRQLLRWVDRMIGKLTMPQLLQLYLTVEQHLGGSQQWLLPVFGATTTGKVPYRDLAGMLRHGLRGTLLEAVAFVLNTPLP